ncbi:helix-turn-helix domain-containing protein [Planococcus shenhongbingii]|uniref:Helix-turn-helix domain-containing protein n=1 Tax=Planococcus shenhongbingii TaxID=3058398 RepID=A0ABT8N8Y2_9BACL|nr:RodZ domain-containing protein [Planococcus sp. N017]MDN7244159.1 helix-turn-helix domain-containing protein [Planococcus sp. N017]
MSELGTRLKEARIAKGYSIEDLQEVTKIQKRYLAGIEEGNYSMMPGPFYARAFIKQYAEAVGLQSDELFEQYKSELPVPARDESGALIAPPTPSRRETFAKHSSNRTGEIMPKVIVALFIVVILAVVVFFYSNLDTNDPIEEGTENEGGVQYEEAAEEQTPAEPAKEPAKEEPAKEPVEKEPAKPKASLDVKGSKGETTTYAWTGPAKRELVIKASGGPSWVQAMGPDQKDLIPARTMAKNDAENIDVTGLSKISIRLGATPNVVLTLNGEPVKYTQDFLTQNIVIQFKDVE